MGGKPLTALAILGFASCDFGPAVIRKLLRGALDKLKEAGACLIGGHSIEDNEFKFGFAVTGVVDRKKILRVNAASPGDTLILTKPLGTGVLTSAQKLGKMRGSGLTKIIASMLKLNKRASEISVSAGAHAATDVTGFGLLGHALNMAKSSHADLLIFSDQVPLMERVKKFIAAGVVPKGARNNLAFCRKDIIFLKDHTQESLLALSDPQTSGGLLIALSHNSLKKFKRIAKKEKIPYWIIGGVIKGRGRIVVR
jgi:selenide,water dikinase